MISNVPREWMPRERWDALLRGEGCPLCAECRSGTTEEGYTVARMQLSQLRLMRNQFLPGYAVLICTTHVPEPYHLGPEDQALFFQDLMRAASALDQVFAPTKMNFEILGNSVPHPHAHLVPRYYGDPAPERPIDQNLHVVTLAPAEYEEQLRRVLTAL